MNAENGFDPTKLRSLQDDLKLLNEAGLRSGLLPRGRDARAQAEPEKADASAKSKSRKAKAAKPDALPDTSPVDPADRGKAGARRLLTMLGRMEGDESPVVPGTDFTEAGVVRLLAHLRTRRSQSFRFLRRLLRFLSRPVPIGHRTSAGIGVERLQIAARQLGEIELHGLAYVRAVRRARRGMAPPPGPEAADQPTKVAAKISASKKAAKPVAKAAKTSKKLGGKTPPARTAAKKTSRPAAMPVRKPKAPAKESR